jgi:imidazolonepropionase-like amidohydrolase
MSTHFKHLLQTLLISGCAVAAVQAQAAAASAVIIENVRIFNGTAQTLSPLSNVLLVGNLIKTISLASIAEPADSDITRIQGNGRTLMPGLIDAHTHMMMNSLPMTALMVNDIGFINIAAAQSAGAMLQRGYTSVRDLGGPVFSLKKSIDMGMVVGPRIWPSGAMISQTGGHADFRLPIELPSAPGTFTYAERNGVAAIADGVDEVQKRAREQLALGASQIKLMAGGGVSSSFDPLDVTQYTVAELKAAVDAADNWGTYVTVHAYTPKAIHQAIEAGVKCIDHGQLIDEASAKLMAEKDIWWSIQPFADDYPSAFAEGSPNRIKQLKMFNGTPTAYALAKKYKVKTAWGTDFLFNPKNLQQQTKQLTKMLQWYTPAETLKMVTHDNAQLLALSGARSPYPGKLGVVEEGALADLLLVNGDPLTDIKLLEDADNNLLVIIKDGKLYKNALK